MTLDLRSDFLGPPTPAMLDAMAAAAAEPDGFELRENRHQRALEAYAAELLGKDDALLFPTCTMANLVAVMAQAKPGDTVVGEAQSHCLTSESGGIAACAGTMSLGLAGEGGKLPLDALAVALGNPAHPQRSTVGLVVLETTHNRAGGRALPLPHVEQVGEMARQAGVPLHIDGARFFNAALSLGATPSAMARPASSVSVSLNKGLCAPNGALLVGSRDLIERALVLRQRLGGGMRPSGVIAAAGLVALETMIPQLQRDHDNARLLATALLDLGFDTGPGEGASNIVLVDVGDGVDAFIGALETAGVLAIGFGPGRLRLCFHRGIVETDVTRIAGAFAQAAKATRERG